MSLRTQRDAAMTAERDEQKFLLPRGVAQSLLRELDAHLPRHHFQGLGHSPLPGADHYTTTLYFDTPSHRILRRVARDPRDNLKLRAREYYDRHPALLETATDASELDVCHPRLWIELKTHFGACTRKQRIGVPKARALEVLAGARLSADHEDNAPEADSAAANELLGTLRSLLATDAEPFVVSLAVHYRRIAWQDAAGSVRVTLDSELAVFPGNGGLLRASQPLVRERLGSPVCTLSQVVAEIKLRGAMPAWLQGWLDQHHAHCMNGGKFLLAGSQLYPEVVAAAAATAGNSRDGVTAS